MYIGIIKPVLKMDEIHSGDLSWGDLLYLNLRGTFLLFVWNVVLCVCSPLYCMKGAEFSLEIQAQICNFFFLLWLRLQSKGQLLQASGCWIHGHWFRVEGSSWTSYFHLFPLMMLVCGRRVHMPSAPFTVKLSHEQKVN